MQFLDFSHNIWLVLASLCVALIAGFTGLSLTQGLSKVSVRHRKVSVALASIALGGGIWSMHFVAMLGLQLPILFYYDALITLMSALVAVLLVGCALLILHFRQRTAASLTVSGLIVGIGILAMHYIGMSALELCQTVYTLPGILVAIVASCSLSVGAFWVAYGKRTHRHIIMGTLCFGLSVFTVHFVAIFNTRFVAEQTSTLIGPLIGNEILAIGVVLTSFALCGAFLLTGVTFLAPAEAKQVVAPDLQPTIAPEPTPPAPPKSRQIPYEQDGRTLFVDAAVIAVIRAEGHYTYLYTGPSKFFCLWSISEAEKRLSGGSFLKCHRSYLINPDHVSSFERMRDNGVCHFDSLVHLKKVPVSRSMLGPVRKALGV